MALVQFYNGTHIQSDTDPSSQQNWVMLICYLVVSVLSLIACSVVVGSVIYSKKTRVKGFNLYLVILLVPDICFNAITTVDMMEAFIVGSWPRKHQCVLGIISIYSYIGMNSWINVFVSKEIFQMLTTSNQVRRFNPSPRDKVLRNAAIVYLVSITFGVLLTVNTKPIIGTVLDSKTCYPRCQDDLCESIRLVIVLFIAVVPTCCLIYFTFVVYKRELLPPAGKSRFLSIYFLRITILSLLFALAIIIALVVDIGGDLLGFFCVCQGFLVSLLSYSKRDVKSAINDTFCCNLTCSTKGSKRSTNNPDVG
jgi:hypothetical protein